MSLIKPAHVLPKIAAVLFLAGGAWFFLHVIRAVLRWWLL